MSTAEAIMWRPWLRSCWWNLISARFIASIHLLLAASPSDYVKHVMQAVRLYNEVLQGHYLSPNEQDNVRKMLVAAKTTVGEARRNQSAVTREVDRVL